MDYSFQSIGPDQIPKDLLLLADPSWQHILSYLHDSRAIAVLLDGNVIGAALIFQEDQRAEILNLAISPAYQNQGLGQQLLSKVLDLSKTMGVSEVRIATGNSSIAQLYLYQKMGFQLMAVDFDYFIREYADPIIENGIRCRHKMILSANVIANPIHEGRNSGGRL